MSRTRNLTFFLTFICSLPDTSNAFCSNQKNCKCFPYRGGVFASCVKSNILDADNIYFNRNVINIDLGWNFLGNIPRNLPWKVQILNLTSNRINIITERSLAKYTRLNHLVVSYCGIKQVSLGAFQMLKQLYTLDISNNQELTLFAITNISKDLQHSTIKSLNFEKLQCRFGITKCLSKEHTKYLQHTRLEELNIAGNKIAVIDAQVIRKFPKTLKYVNIADSQLSFGYYLFELSLLENVRVVNASFQNYPVQIRKVYLCNDNSQEHIDEACQISFKNIETKGGHFVNKILKKYKSTADKKHLQHPRDNVTVYLPSKLEKIYLSDCMYKLAFDDFYIRSNSVPAITDFHMQNNMFFKWKGPVFDFTSVQYLDLSNNICMEVSDDFFYNVDDMAKLNLSRNFLGTSIQNDRYGNIFRGFRNLKSIDLSYNRIVVLPKPIFRNMKKIEHLNLSNNSIATFDIHFRHMRHLTFLDLSYNAISTINKDTRTVFNDISQKKSVKINLLGNNLRCTCKEIDFIRWLHNPSNITFMNISRYRCVYLNSSRVSLENLDLILNNLEKNCEKYTVLMLLLTTFIVISLTCAVCRVIYRYRWSLRYWYYVAKREDNKPSTDMGNTRYRYHAFISYSQGDMDFVLNEIVPFEKQHGFQFLIHDRDFIPGAPIADNITNAIHSSKRTICIVTPHFLKSHWCMFELNMAHMESIYSRRGEGLLMLIILDKNVVKQMPRDMINIVETESYLEYPDESAITTSAFWNQFSEAINSQ